MTQNTFYVSQRYKTLYFMDFMVAEEKKPKNALGEQILDRQLKIEERQAIFGGLN